MLKMVFSPTRSAALKVWVTSLNDLQSADCAIRHQVRRFAQASGWARSYSLSRRGFNTFTPYVHIDANRDTRNQARAGKIRHTPDMGASETEERTGLAAAGLWWADRVEGLVEGRGHG